MPFSTRPLILLPLVALAGAPATAFAQAPASAATSQQPSTGPAITVTNAKRAEIVQSVVVSGSMIARDEVLVTPEVDGFVITELLAEEGDRVAAGQVLARLSRTTLEVQRQRQCQPGDLRSARRRRSRKPGPAELGQAGAGDGAGGPCPVAGAGA